jgi:hypothetical protein
MILDSQAGSIRNTNMTATQTYCQEDISNAIGREDALGILPQLNVIKFVYD